MVLTLQADASLSEGFCSIIERATKEGFRECLTQMARPEDALLREGFSLIMERVAKGSGFSFGCVALMVLRGAGMRMAS